MRKAWEALAVEEEFDFVDSQGDADLDQVLWALLDNAVKYDAGDP